MGVHRRAIPGVTRVPESCGATVGWVGRSAPREQTTPDDHTDDQTLAETAIMHNSEAMAHRIVWESAGL